MRITELFLAELEREADRCRKALAQVPEGRRDWKPHDRSMVFGYLAELVATMPSWIAMTINQDELDLSPPGGQPPRQALDTSAALLAALDKAAAEARAALEKTSDEFLMTSWRLLVGGQAAFEARRHVVIQDAFNHLAHHRGQLTVYLRLLGAKVPALYGPSADDRTF
jgi:uncharacterized damage-inducible protein DinB